MQFTDLQPILDEPALLFEEKKLLVIADLHIGIERELQKSGLQVPSQTNLMEQRLISILQTYDVQHIVLLGDIKHNIPSSTIQERTDVQRFLETIKPYGRLYVLPGNHDGNIDRLLSAEIVLYPSDGAVFEGIGFAHGHRWPRDEIMQCKRIIVSHMHPMIMLTDRLGYKTFEPCWLRGHCLQNVLKEKYPASTDPEIVIMPAFNPLCGGIAVNRDQLLGPFRSLIDVDNADVYLLDGSSLGKVKVLRQSS